MLIVTYFDVIKYIDIDALFYTVPGNVVAFLRSVGNAHIVTMGNTQSVDNIG